MPYKHKVRSLLAGCVLLLWTAATAQQQDSAVTLQQLLAGMRVNAPSLAADSAAVSVKQQQLHATGYNWLPSFKLNYQVDAGTNNNLPGGYFGFGIIPSNSRVREAGNSSTILTNLGIASLDWELYNFGAYNAQKSVAQSDVNVEEARFSQSRYQLQAYAIDAYLQLVRLQDLLAIQQQNISRNEEIRRSILALAKSGIKAGVDTSIATAELSRARLVAIEINNQIMQIRLQLGTLSGIAPQKLVADTGIEKQMMQQLSGTLPGITDTALHPSIAYYQSLYQNSLDKEALVKKSYNPKVSLQAAAWGRGSSVSAADEFRPLSKGIGFERGNYLVGLGITWNVFDLKRKQLQLHTQKAMSTYAQKKLNEQNTLLQLGIGQANTEVLTAAHRLEEIPNQLNAAQAAYRQKLSLYKNGLTDIIELNMALNLLYRAETDYTTAKYNYCKAVFQKAVTENRVEDLLQLLN